jgi:hypothetical protein
MFIVESGVGVAIACTLQKAGILAIRGAKPGTLGALGGGANCPATIEAVETTRASGIRIAASEAQPAPEPVLA